MAQRPEPPCLRQQLSPPAASFPRRGRRLSVTAAAAAAAGLVLLGHAGGGCRAFAATPAALACRRVVGSAEDRLPASGGLCPRGPPSRAPRSTATAAAVIPGAAVEVEHSRLVQLWSVLGVSAYLSYGVRKVVPIVKAGIAAIDATWQWAFLAATIFFFAYVEGYKGFTKGFAPRVVSRAWALSSRRGAARGSLLHRLLAPGFCIGYFHGTRKRVVTSWCVTAIIFLVVVSVKRLPNPYRGIIDAGVIVGLLWGVASIIAIYARSLLHGRPPDFDPSLPEGSPYA